MIGTPYLFLVHHSVFSENTGRKAWEVRESFALEVSEKGSLSVFVVGGPDSCKTIFSVFQGNPIAALCFCAPFQCLAAPLLWKEL